MKRSLRPDQSPEGVAQLLTDTTPGEFGGLGEFCWFHAGMLADEELTCQYRFMLSTGL
jgi:hypothetical protein